MTTRVHFERVGGGNTFGLRSCVRVNVIVHVDIAGWVTHPNTGGDRGGEYRNRGIDVVFRLIATVVERFEFQTAGQRVMFGYDIRLNDVLGWIDVSTTRIRGGCCSPRPARLIYE